MHFSLYTPLKMKWMRSLMPDYKIRVFYEFPCKCKWNFWPGTHLDLPCLIPSAQDGPHDRTLPAQMIRKSVWQMRTMILDLIQSTKNLFENDPIEKSVLVSLLPTGGRFGSPASGEKSTQKSTQKSNSIEKYWRKHSKMHSKKCSNKKGLKKALYKLLKKVNLLKKVHLIKKVKF